MITKEQAKQIMILASNYANYEVAAETNDIHGYYNQSNKMSEKSAKTWTDLKTLVESLTVDTNDC